MPKSSANSWTISMKDKSVRIQVNVDPKKTPHFYFNGGDLERRHWSWGKFDTVEEAWKAATEAAGWSVAESGWNS